ncbi:MAG TPA: hypothetical protein VMN60_03445 [Longimicrobiales bacterium]|nr:hypothetical protein [Longimicrobiales bacterium]
MAHRMRWVVGIVAASAVVVLFVQSLDLPQGYYGPPEMAQRRLLNGQLNREERLLRETVWLAELSPLLPRENGLRVVVSPLLRDSSVRVFQGAIDREWQAIGEPRARVGVFVIPDTLGAYRHEFGPNPRGPSVYYAGVDDLGPYCMVVMPQYMFGAVMAAPLTARSLPESNVLGPCRWWATYGAPGPQLAQWLRQAGYRLAMNRPPVVRDAVAPVRDRAFARRRPNRDMSALAESCIIGNADHCLQTVVTPHTDSELSRWTPFAYGGSPAIAYGRVYWGSVHFSGRENAILAELERDYGAERFARFWRSDTDVQTAFATVYGTAFATWLQQWARARFSGVERPRVLNGMTLLLSLLTLGALAAAGIIEAQRRQIR